MSQFSKISKTLFTEAQKNNGMISFFLVGCYPNKGGNPFHEYPLILRNMIEKYPGLNISIYLIDPEYKNGYIPQFLYNYEFNNGMYRKNNLAVMIYPYPLLDKSFSHDWDRLYELCKNVTTFNCSSIIFNFSGVNEIYFDYHPSIYFSPTDCLGNVENEIKYNPIIEIEEGIPKIFNPKDLNEIEALLNSQIDNNKINFCYWKFSDILKLVNNAYLKIYNVVTSNRDYVYDKQSRLLHKSIDHLLYRSEGKYKNIIEKIIYEWINSETQTLKIYVKNKLDEYMLTSLIIKYKEKYQEHLDEIKIGKNNSYYNIVNHFMN